MAAFPTDPSLAERGIRDGVGGAYVDMHARNELLQTGGRAVDIAELIAGALERFGPPVRLTADRWREAELRDVLDRARVPVTALESRGQGYKDGRVRARDDAAAAAILAVSTGSRMAARPSQRRRHFGLAG